MNKYELRLLFVLCEKLGIKTLKELENFKNEKGIANNSDLLSQLGGNLAIK